MSHSKVIQVLYGYAQCDAPISDQNVKVFFRNRNDLFKWFIHLFQELDVISLMNITQRDSPRCSRFRRPESHENCVFFTLVKFFAIKQNQQPRIELSAENTNVLIEHFNTFSCGETMKAFMKVFSVDEAAAIASIHAIMKVDEDRALYLMHLLKIYLLEEYFPFFVIIFSDSKTTYTRYFFFFQLSDLSHLDFDAIIENDFRDIEKEYPDEVMFFRFFRKLDAECFDDILDDKYPPLNGNVVDGYLTRYPLMVLSDAQMWTLYPNATRNRLVRKVRYFFRRKRSPISHSVILEQFESIRKLGCEYFAMFCQTIRETMENFTDEELSLKDKQFFQDTLLDELDEIDAAGYCFEKPNEHSDEPTEVLTIPDGHEICLVENETDFESFLDEIQAAELVGIDAEWYSGLFYLQNAKQIEIFQVATFNKTFILDFRQLSASLSTEILLNRLSDRFLTNESILKLGHCFNNDMDMLGYMWKNDCREHRTFTISNLIELKNVLHENSLISADNKESLSELIRRITGRSLEKREQLSNWSVRPLRESQILYAAADAYSLLVCYRIALGEDKDEDNNEFQN